MSDKKSWGSTVLGWFVVQEPGDEAPPDATPDAGSYRPFEDVKAPLSAGKPGESDEDLIKRAAAGAPPASAAQIAVFNTPPPPPTGGEVNYDQVFEAAGIDAAERERVTRTLDLLNA